MRLDGRVMLVTGGNSGIGRAIAMRGVQEGARVIVGGRDAKKGGETVALVEGLGGAGVFVQGDLTDEADCKALVARAAAQFGRLDILINCAGAGARRSGVVDDDDPATRLRKVMAPNLEAAYFVSAHAMPHLAKAGRGTIVNISSTAAFHGHWGTYGVAKAAVEALTRSLAAEGAPAGIRANSVSPGWIKTTASPDDAADEWEKGVSLLGRMGTPDEIARAVIFLASDEASFITGTTLIVDGGLMTTDYCSLPWLEAAGAWKLFPGTLGTSPESAK